MDKLLQIPLVGKQLLPQVLLGVLRLVKLVYSEEQVLPLQLRVFLGRR